MTHAVHPELELQDLIDGRLDAVERARIQAHVDTCARCRAEVDTLRNARDMLRRLSPVDPPPHVAARLAGVLARAADAERERPRVRSIWRWSAWGLAAAAAVLVVVTVMRRDDLPDLAIRSAVASAQALDLTTSDTAALEAFFASRLPFHTRVFDLAMMNYRLAGGRVGTIGSRQVAIFRYTGPADRRLTCEMYEGTVDELPPPDARREQNGITFFIFRRGATTTVFWAEGHLICVAVSDLPTDDVVALAIAKAQKS